MCSTSLTLASAVVFANSGVITGSLMIILGADRLMAGAARLEGKTSEATLP